MKWAKVKTLAWNYFAFFMWWHTECLDILVLSLVFTVFWCMSSACRIHLHANFLHFPLRQMLTMIHILCVTSQTRWEWISQNGSTRFFMIVCVWQGGRQWHTQKKKQRREKRRQHVFLIVIYLFLYIYIFLCPILSAPLGHRENSSICDFKLHSCVPLALWGKTHLTWSRSVFLFFISTS